MYENIFESLDHEVTILRKAIEDGIYGTRSIVGDQCLRIESEIKNLKKTTNHLTNQYSVRDNPWPCPKCGGDAWHRDGCPDE